MHKKESENKRKLNNKGFTLVEVVVSMLIISFIAIPLLNTFIMSKKANLKARQVQYGTLVAQNILEAIQEFGVEDIARQFHLVATFDIFNSKSSPNLTYYQCKLDNPYVKIEKYEKYKGSDSDVIESSIIEIATGIYEYNELEKQSYTIENIKEGTMLFDAVIEFNASGYSGDNYNDYVMPDLTTLNSAKTERIYPDLTFFNYDDGNAKITNSYDLMAINILYGAYTNAVAQKNVEIDVNNAANGTAEPNIVPDTKKAFSKKLNKVTNIYVDYSSSEDKYYVYTELIYSMGTSVEDYGFLTADEKTYKTYPLGAGIKDELAELENIYIFYTQFAYYENQYVTKENGSGEYKLTPSYIDVSGADSFYLNISADAQNKLAADGKKLNVFLTAEKDYCSDTITQIPFNTNVAAPDTVINFMSNKTILSTSGINSTKVGDDKYIVADDETKTRIYQVVVTVYWKDSVTSSKTKVTTMSTTIIN